VLLLASVRRHNFLWCLASLLYSLHNSVTSFATWLDPRVFFYLLFLSIFQFILFTKIQKIKFFGKKMKRNERARRGSPNYFFEVKSLTYLVENFDIRESFNMFSY
jgi:hypothetical protein